jgi:tRNA nucleotidyltransferase (CCA-adding enzyme)
MATELVIDKVGSTTTLLVERLKEAGIKPAPHEATLFVLGIRADTGGLVYQGTTIRDASALLWCLENGASQVAISEFGVARVSEEQRMVLNAALRYTQTRTIRGLQVSYVLLKHQDGYVAGLAHVCEELLDLTDSDVFLLGAIHSSGGGATSAAGGGKKKSTSSNESGGGDQTQKASQHDINQKSKKNVAEKAEWVSLIGRASPRAVGVDLNAVMRTFGGGGHPKAAAAAVRCVPSPPSSADAGVGQEQYGELDDEDEDDHDDHEQIPSKNHPAVQVMASATAMVESQIPEQLVASSFMAPLESLVTVSCDDTVATARKIFEQHNLKSAPVVEEEEEFKENGLAGVMGGFEKVVRLRYRGSLKLSDLVNANRKGKNEDKIRGMMRSNVQTVLPKTPLAELEELLVFKGVGRLPVVDEEGILLGVVTRTHILRQHKMYGEDDLPQSVQ